MNVRITTVLTCDRCGVVGETQLRSEARIRGWTRVNGWRSAFEGDRWLDLCPDCSPAVVPRWAASSEAAAEHPDDPGRAASATELWRRATGPNRPNQEQT